jgi:hypothetical protein
MVPLFAQEPPAQTPPPDQTPAKTDQKAAEPAKTDAKAESPAPATEQWFTGSVDFGYRWVTDVSGNFQQYRSVVNLGQGPKLLGLDFTITDPKHRLFDRLDASAYGWGGDPYSTARVDARKSAIYNFTFDYRDIAYFNAVPSYANPFAPAGFDEQSFDIHRRTLSTSLDFFNGKHFSPYLAFDRNSGYGHGIDTWAQDANDEFAVPTLLRDSTDNFRGGIRFEFNHFHATLEQGGTIFKDDDQSNYSGTNTGDRTGSVLGETLVLNSLEQAYGIRGHSIYEKALVTANPFPWLNLYGQFLYSEPKTEVHFAEIATGNFVNMSSLLFYNTQYTLGMGAANQPHTTGNVGFEIRPIRRLRIIESWMTDRYHDAASPLVAEQLFLTPTTLGPNSITALNYGQVVNYNQEQVDVLFDVTSKLVLRGGYRYIWGDATVLAGELSQTGSMVSGQLQRNVGLAGLTFRTGQKLSFNVDFEGASSDNVYFRTSLNDYQKVRARAKYQLNSAFTVQTNFQVLHNQNPSPDIRYEFQGRDNSVSVYWTPNGGKRISVTGQYDRSTFYSNIDYITLPFLGAGVSSYRDNAHTATSAIDFSLPWLPGAKLTTGGSLFISSGSRPSRYYQPLARLALPFGKHVFWNTEWQYYGYGEQFYLYEGFRTHIFMTGLRLIR